MTHIILTGAVHSSIKNQTRGSITDSYERLVDYLCAIRAWTEQPDISAVMYVDASGFHIPNIFQSLKYHPFHLDLTEQTQVTGKGYSESLSIKHVLDLFPSIQTFYKCTGRLYIKNFSEIHKGIPLQSPYPTVNYHYMPRWPKTTDTRFFYMPTPFYLENIHPHIGEICETAGPDASHTFSPLLDKNRPHTPCPLTRLCHGESLLALAPSTFVLRGHPPPNPATSDALSANRHPQRWHESASTTLVDGLHPFF